MSDDLIEQLRKDADFVDADTYDECWEVKETPRGQRLRQAAERISALSGENARLREIASNADRDLRAADPERRIPEHLSAALADVLDAMIDRSET